MYIWLKDVLKNIRYKIFAIFCILGMFGWMTFVYYLPHSTSESGTLYFFSVFIIVSLLSLAVFFIMKSKMILPCLTKTERREILKEIVQERRGKEKIHFDDILISHYDFGNVTDPLGLLHDENGKPLLATNEKGIKKVEDICLEIIYRRSSAIRSYGQGILYRTDKRLIYLVNPQPSGEVTSRGFLGMPSQVSKALSAEEWKDIGRNICISIPLTRVEEYHRVTDRLRFFEGFSVSTSYKGEKLIAKFWPNSVSSWPSNRVIQFVADVFKK